MVLMKGKMMVRGGALYQPGELYSGPHEAFAIEKGLAVLVNEPPKEKAPASPPAHKQVKHPPKTKSKRRSRRKG